MRPQPELWSPGSAAYLPLRLGYWHDNTNYVVHPDLSFTLDLPRGYRHCFLEFERRATIPRRVRARLENYRRYFRSSYARQDHVWKLPLVLFLFETHDAEDAFLLASGAHRLPICTSNLELINDLGVLREVWRRTPPTGCRCTGWVTDTKLYLPVPGICCRGAMAKGDFQGTNPVRSPRPGAGTFCCRTGAQTGPVSTL